MTKKGQIVEIPATSAIYKDGVSHFGSKKEELTQQLEKRNYNLFDGYLVGEHLGVGNFILGQRKGINVGGKDAPLYVIGINKSTNQLFVGEGEQHPGLRTTLIGFHSNQMNPTPEITTESNDKALRVQVHSPSTQTALSADLYIFGESCFLKFDTAVSIAIQNQPLEIRFADQSITIININQ